MGKYIRKSVMVALLAVIGSMVSGCGSDSTTNTNGNASVFYATSLAFRNNSTVGWGYNGFGQLGDGTTTTHTDPRARALIGIKGVAQGGFHSLAFGTYTTWSSGGNSFGQLGRTLATNVTQDVGFNMVNFSNLSAAKRPRKIVTIAAGGMHNLLADDESGRVWAWGAGGDGQLGNGLFANSTAPVLVLSTIINGNGTDFLLGTADTPVKRAVAAGGSHSLALDKDGKVYAWGRNQYGQLGQTTVTAPANPTVVTGLPFSSAVPIGLHITQIAAGGSYSLALDSAGNVWAWGINFRGELGVDWVGLSGFTFRAAPALVPNIANITAIAAGLDHVVALKNDGTVWAWGFNGFGQLGDNTRIDRFTPQQVISTALTGVTEIRAFGNHSFAKAGDGKWYAWGDNSQGQLGYITGSLTYSMLPLPVPGW